MATGTDEAGLKAAGMALEYEPGSDEILFGLLGAVQNYVLRLTLDGRIASINRPWPGVEQTLIVGRRLSELLPAGQHERLESVLRDVAQSGQTHELEVSLQGLADGSECALSIGPISSDERVVGFIAVTSHLAGRRGIEAELRESQNKLRIALAASRVGMWSWDAEGDTVQWDAATRDIFGAGEPKSYDEFIKLVHPDDRKLMARHVAHALETGEYRELEHRIVRPDGVERWVLARAEVIKDATGKNHRLIGGILDISERRLMEDKLRQAQKMEALGELTAGLAHNFNNALMAILPNVEQAAKGASPRVVALLDVARQAAERAARLVGELMVFAGGGRTSERRDESLGSVVRRAVAICRSTFSPQIAVELGVDEEAPILSIDAAQIEHAVINVCINARDALEGISGRTPTLHVQVTRIKAGAAELMGPAPKPERDHACISFSDNGTGMPEAVQRRIFEPFFTTKEIGKGTGLGLSTTYAIVREHGGFIACESELGVGTTFALYLPVERSGRRKDSGAMALPAPGGTEHLLIVDDDPVVRGVTARVLSSAGYRIHEAADGTQGLAVFEQQRRDIRLVLLDESMPGIAGHEVLARMLVLEPEARVAMFTGVQPAPEQLRGARAVIRKPIGANELLWKVRQLLEDS